VPGLLLVGDRSFILGDRSSEKTHSDRSLCVMGRSPLVESSQCLVFGARGDRSFILGDRSSEKKKGRCYAMLFSLTSAIGSTIATKATGIGTK